MSKKMINCKVCNAEIAKKAKRCPQCGAKNKKPIFKRVWFWVVIVIVFIGVVGSGGDNAPDSPTPAPVSTPQIDIPSTPKPESKPAEENLSFELIAGEEGEYGELFTINKDTEFEETYYIYHVPVGTYTVTNTGEYLSQLSVYSDEIVVNDAGWEEVAEVFYAKAFMVEESDTVEVVKDSFIEIHEPACFSFEFISDGAPAEKSPEEAKEEPKEEPEEEPKEEPEPENNLTLGQINALLSAESYLSFMAFSYEGLIDQLEYEGYTTEEATYAADKCGADWNKQALKSAENYLDFMAFSYTGLIDQLEYEKYTTEQATYAADNCGADWFEQAAKCAETYLDTMSFSRQGLIDQLKYEGFTTEQAEYGVEQNGY